MKLYVNQYNSGALDEYKNEIVEYDHEQYMKVRINDFGFGPVFTLVAFISGIYKYE